MLDKMNVFNFYFIWRCSIELSTNMQQPGSVLGIPHHTYISKLATVVEGDEKIPFSIATTPRCRGGRYSFPWIAPLYPRYIPYIAEC